MLSLVSAQFNGTLQTLDDSQANLAKMNPDEILETEERSGTRKSGLRPKYDVIHWNNYLQESTWYCTRRGTIWTACHSL